MTFILKYKNILINLLILRWNPLCNVQKNALALSLQPHQEWPCFVLSFCKYCTLHYNYSMQSDFTFCFSQCTYFYYDAYQSRIATVRSIDRYVCSATYTCQLERRSIRSSLSVIYSQSWGRNTLALGSSASFRLDRRHNLDNFFI